MPDMDRTTQIQADGGYVISVRDDSPGESFSGKSQDLTADLINTVQCISLARITTRIKFLGRDDDHDHA